jgi:hypothetical protein
MIMDGHWQEPINLGSSALVTINQLVDIVESTADVKLKRSYDLSAPKGVRGSNRLGVGISRSSRHGSVCDRWALHGLQGS